MSAPATPLNTAQIADNQFHCDLLTWKDPVKTGKVFGAIMVVLLVFKTVNLFNVFFHFAYIGLLLSALFEYAGKLVIGQGFVSKYKPAAKSYAKKVNDEVLPHVADFNVKLETEIQKILYAHDIETTLKGAGISYILYKVTSLFSLYTLVVAGVVALFTGPAIYVRNKKEIDAAVAQYTEIAKEKSAEYTKLAQEKAGPHLDALATKAGPVGAFIKKNLPTRTAGSTVGDDRTSSYDNDSTGMATGASKFPDVPSSRPQETSGLEEFVEENKGSGPESL